MLEERRKRGLGPAIARGTYDWRKAAPDFDKMLCRMFGHAWSEIPKSFGGRAGKVDGKVRFSCTRCSQRAGFTS